METRASLQMFVELYTASEINPFVLTPYWHFM